MRELIVNTFLTLDERLFADGTVPAGLKLAKSEVSSTGVVMGTYEPAGEVPIGSFALDPEAS